MSCAFFLFGKHNTGEGRMELKNLRCKENNGFFFTRAGANYRVVKGVETSRQLCGGVRLERRLA
jgi:hypothetical protein